MIHRKSNVALGIFAAICVMRAAAAATSMGSIAVSAIVVSACAVSAPPLSFGNPVLGTALTASTTVTVTCNAATGIPFNIGFDQGGRTDATVASRKMTSLNGNLVNYALYRDAGRTPVWGNTAETDGVAETIGASPTVLTLHGRISPARTTQAGADCDIINVTLTY